MGERSDYASSSSDVNSFYKLIFVFQPPPLTFTIMSSSLPVIAIYDIGKTNKKVFLFNEAYEVVYEKSATLPETTDEDGYPCENLALLTQWIRESFAEIAALKEFKIVALNFTSYGASFVHIDKNGEPLTPLYNYLKPYPDALKKKFYDRYGGEIMLSMHTASPVLGSLNSGMQLYRLKYEQKAVFDQIAYSLHLPRYGCGVYFYPRKGLCQQMHVEGIFSEPAVHKDPFYISAFQYQVGRTDLSADDIKYELMISLFIAAE